MIVSSDNVNESDIDHKSDINDNCMEVFNCLILLTFSLLLLPFLSSSSHFFLLLSFHPTLIFSPILLPISPTPHISSFSIFSSSFFLLSSFSHFLIILSSSHPLLILSPFPSSSILPLSTSASSFY
uniref:Uncharacterized protein n=1 Tax=Meloidogyne enterolobii TaxID=390850 RepID=A0A6V7WHB8_MELEN|nr:unnamed protein product [Meloidogyne enterolobii]